MKYSRFVRFAQRSHRSLTKIYGKIASTGKVLSDLFSVEGVHRKEAFAFPDSITDNPSST